MAPCSRPSTSLRVAFGDGLRPMLTAAARAASWKSGRDEETPFSRTKKLHCSHGFAILQNLTHTTPVRSTGRNAPASHPSSTNAAHPDALPAAAATPSLRTPKAAALSKNDPHILAPMRSSPSLSARFSAVRESAIFPMRPQDRVKPTSACAPFARCRGGKSGARGILI